MNIGPIIEVGDRPPEPLIIPPEREPEQPQHEHEQPLKEPIKIPEKV